MDFTNICGGPFQKFIMMKTITSMTDIGLTDEYVSTFEPNGYVRYWIR